MSETFMFAFCLLDTGALLFLLVYYVSLKCFCLVNDFKHKIEILPHYFNTGDHLIRLGVRLSQCPAVLLKS